LYGFGRYWKAIFRAIVKVQCYVRRCGRIGRQGPETAGRAYQQAFYSSSRLVWKIGHAQIIHKVVEATSAGVVHKALARQGSPAVDKTRSILTMFYLFREA
jgi:hypothetical protein